MRLHRDAVAQADPVQLNADALRALEIVNEGTPIYVTPLPNYKGEWADGWYIFPWDYKFNMDEYGETWVAYLHKPQKQQMHDAERRMYMEKQVASWPDWKKSYTAPESIRKSEERERNADQ